MSRLTNVAGGADRIHRGQIQELRVGELLDQSLGLLIADPEQRTGDPAKKVTDVQHAQQPKRSLLLAGQRPVAQGEAGPDLRVAGGQVVQPAVFVGQQIGQRPSGTCRSCAPRSEPNVPTNHAECLAASRDSSGSASSEATPLRRLLGSAFHDAVDL